MFPITPSWGRSHKSLALEPVTEHGMPFINFRQKHNRAMDDQSGDKPRGTFALAAGKVGRVGGCSSGRSPLVPPPGSTPTLRNRDPEHS